MNERDTTLVNNNRLMIVATAIERITEHNRDAIDKLREEHRAEMFAVRREIAALQMALIDAGVLKCLVTKS